MISFIARTDEGKIKIQAKSSWDEVTFSEFLQIEKASKELDSITIFSILTGIDFSVIANSKDKELPKVLSEVTKSIYDNPVWENIAVPKDLLLNGTPYKVPTDLENITFGQRVLISQLYRDNDNIHEAMPRAVAIIMIPSIFGQYDTDTQNKVKEVTTWVENSSAVPTYGAAQFFFQKSPELSIIGHSYFKGFQLQEMIQESEN